MESGHLPRKLAAILYADVAGYSRLTGEDEDTTHQTLSAYLDLFSSSIERHRGRVMHYAGDAVLAMLEAVVDALSCAASVQRELQARNEDVPDERKVQFRVGVNLGDVIEDRGDIYGDGVNVAARLESLAEPGGICISRYVYDQVKNKLELGYECLGEQQVKNIAEPVEVYRVRLEPEAAGTVIDKKRAKSHHWHWSALAAVVVIMVGGGLAWFQPWVPREEPASVERMAFPLPEKPSIAVLPFTNMSGDPEQEYFVDGVTEDLITDLSKISSLFIIARNSSFSYKGQQVKVHQVAEELGVRYVLEGSVRRAGEQVRINAQLIDATTGGHLWAERYDGSLTDIFTLQDNVTEKIVTALALNLTGERTTKRHAAGAQAYDLFLQGWAHYQRHTADDLAKAVPHFEAAIRLDSDYTQAHAALAAVYWEIWDDHWAEALDISLSDAMKNAKEHLEEAMKEPTSLEHRVASNILIAEENYETAVTEAKQIVSLDTNNADGYATLANALALVGKPDESANLIEKAVRLDPYSSPLHTAAQKGDADAMRRLIADGVKVDTKDYYGKTPLHVATENGHAEVAASLIEAGADIEMRMNARGPRLFAATPLIVAARSGLLGVAELLISAGADVNARDISIEI